MIVARFTLLVNPSLRYQTPASPVGSHFSTAVNKDCSFGLSLCHCYCALVLAAVLSTHWCSNRQYLLGKWGFQRSGLPVLSPLTVSCNALCTSGGQFRVRFCQRFRWTEAEGNEVVGGSKENIAPTAEILFQRMVLFCLVCCWDQRECYSSGWYYYLW